MKKFRRIGLSLVLAVMLTLSLVVPALAANPQVAITVTAQVVSITNSQANWAIGIVATSDVKYFSVDNEADPDWSRITNTGSVAVDIAIQGANIEGGTYDWTIATDGIAASETYGLNATAGNGTGEYSTIVRTTPFNDLTTDLAADDIWDWSMCFQAPTAFNANDDGNSKNTTIILVASKYTPP